MKENIVDRLLLPKTIRSFCCIYVSSASFLFIGAALLQGLSNFIQTPSVDRCIFPMGLTRMVARCGPISKYWPLYALSRLPARSALASCHSSWDTQNLRHKLMVFMPNRSTPDYFFKKAEQCFQRSLTASNVRVELEAPGNAFMVQAVELDIELQKLAKGSYTASFPAQA
jgi:hypothetical protein